MKTKSAVTVTKLFLIFLVTGLIALIDATPVFAQSFASPTSYTVGTNPFDGALGDFNGDGKPDLAVANNSTNNISVLLGNGGGTFGVKTDYDVGQPAYGVVIADLNSDGKLDIVAETAFSTSEGVSVLLGNGNGSFQTRVDYLFSGLAQPKSILASDFNNDTKPDIVVINGSGATVFLGNGDGSLKPPVSYGSSDFATSVAVGDFNADGKIDLAVSSYGFSINGNGVVSIMLGKGDGTFFPSVNYPTGLSPFSIVKGDFNGDTKLDLATANIQVGTVSILLGNGDGTFGSAVNHPASDFPYELSTGDLNSDGKTDLVSAGNGGGLSILKGNGDGTFQKPVNFLGGAFFATVLDLNGDAKPDIISAQTATSVAVFINQTGPHNISGTVRDNNNVPLSAATLVLTGATPVIFKTDATGTFAFNDLTAGQTYTVTVSKPNYTFAPPNQTFNNLASNVTANFVGTLNNYSISGSVRDISGVGMAGVTMTLSGSMTGTIVTGVNGSYAFANLPGGGNYTVTPSLAKFMFSPPSFTANNLSSNRVVNFTGRVATYTISGGVISAEFGTNLDGFTIELTGTRTGTAITTSSGGYNFSGLPVDGDYTVTAYLANRLFTNHKLLPPTSRSFAALSSDVTGANFSARRLAFSTGNLNPAGIACGDLNGDGKLDVVVATTTGSNIHVLLGNGDGTLQSQVAYPADSNPTDVVIADFDGDGKADVAATNGFGSNVSVFIGNGDGTLKTRVNYPVGAQQSNLSVSDFNNDGKIDLAVLGPTLSILLGNGNGTFQPAINRTIANAAFSVLPGDLNGDSKPDLVLLGFPGSVLVLKGRGDGTFDDPVSYPAPNEVVKATLADLNADGKLDVAVASRLPDKLTILLGRGDGTFQNGTTTSMTSGAADLISYDFDGNGKLDLVIAGEAGGFGFLSGNGDGTFSPPVFYQAGSHNASLVAGDFNNDNKLDFVLSSQGSDEVNILLNSAPTPFTPPTIFVEQGTANKAAALDAVTRLRGPFPIHNTNNFSADRLTRVMLFTSNLGLTQPDSSILSVRANGILLTVESVGTVTGVQGLDASYIIVKLTDDLGIGGNLPLTVTLHGVASSNAPILEVSLP